MAGKRQGGRRLRAARLKPGTMLRRLTPQGNQPSAPLAPPEVESLKLALDGAVGAFLGIFGATYHSPADPWDCPRCQTHVERSNACPKCFTRNPAGTELSYPNARRLCFRPRQEYTLEEMRRVVSEQEWMGWDCERCDAAAFCETLTTRNLLAQAKPQLPAHGEPAPKKRGKP